MGDLFKLSDSYNRIARLYPAVIALVPILWTAAITAPRLVELDLTRTVATAVVATALLYALASVARSRGKILEPKLLERWGGWPTTAMLRYRNQIHDPHTKARYHAALRKLCPTLPWPSEDDERRNPDEADKIYRSATLALVEHRRDPNYKHLHRENASYGFRRNLLGLKPIATMILFGCAIATSGVWHFRSEVISTDTLGLLLAADVATLIFWFGIVRPQYVYQSAVEYGLALFRTLDEPNPAI
jgi:hypothetical protein